MASCGEISLLANQIETKVMGLQTDLDTLAQCCAANQADLEEIKTDLGQIKLGVNGLPDVIGAAKDVITTAISSGQQILLAAIEALSGGADYSEILNQIWLKVNETYVRVDGISNRTKDIYEYLTNNLVLKIDSLASKINEIFNYIKSITDIYSGIQDIKTTVNKIWAQFPIKLDDTRILAAIAALASTVISINALLGVINRAIDLGLKAILALLTTLASKKVDLSPIEKRLTSIETIQGSINNRVSVLPSIYNLVQKIWAQFPIKIPNLTPQLQQVIARLEALKEQLSKTTQTISTTLTNIQEKIAELKTKFNETNSIIAAARVAILAAIATLSGKIKEPILSLPEYFGLRPGVDRPSLVIIYKEKNGDKWGQSTFSTTIPNPKASIIAALPNLEIEPKEQGIYFASLGLLDNSQVRVSLSSKASAKAYLQYLLTMVDPSVIPDDLDKRIIEGTNQRVKTIQLYARKIEWYPQGKQDNRNPDYERLID
jgi:hypothetical protein